MDISITHLIWTTIFTIIISHFGANYLITVTPKGYWFWFTLLNIGVGLLVL